MPSGVFPPTQRPCRFNHHIDPGLTPGNFAGISFRGKLERFPMHQQRPRLVGHLSRKEAMDGIILEEIGKIAEVSTIIDCHNLNVSKGKRASQDHTTNTSKTVNTNTTCHTLLILYCYGHAAQDCQHPLRARGCSMGVHTSRRLPTRAHPAATRVSPFQPAPSAPPPPCDRRGS